MGTDKKEFVALSADMDDRLDRLADAKGVPKLVHPSADTAGQGAGVSQPSPETEIPRTRMKSVTLDLPDYLWSELKIRAVQDESSLRHIVMSALKTAGFTINSEDMIQDGRRVR